MGGGNRREGEGCWQREEEDGKRGVERSELKGVDGAEKGREEGRAERGERERGAGRYKRHNLIMGSLAQNSLEKFDLHPTRASSVARLPVSPSSTFLPFLVSLLLRSFHFSLYAFYYFCL